MDNAATYYFPPSGGEYESIWVRVDDNPDGLSTEDWAKALYRRESGGAEPSPGDLTYSTIQVGDGTGTKVTGVPSRVTEFIVLLPHGSRMYTWGLDGGIDSSPPSDQPSFVTEFEQFLQSVRFTD